MSTAISVLGVIGLFLLGMTVMTDALKALAGSSLRVVLSKRALAAVCESLVPALAAASRRQEGAPGKFVGTVEHAAEALRQAQEFMSRMNGPPDSEEEQERLTSTLHALDHASRLAETARETPESKELANAPDDMRAAALCDDAMRYATIVAKQVAGGSCRLLPCRCN